MEEQLTFRELFKEVGGVAVKFFRSCNTKDDLMKIPKKIKKSGTKVEVLNLGMGLIGITFSYLLTVTNMAIEQKMVFLGIALFMLYRSQQVAKEAYHLFQAAESEKNRLVVKNEVSLRGSQIIGKTSNKVQKFNKKNGTWRVMTDEEVLNCVKKYLANVWEGSIVHKFQMMEIVSVLMMLIVAVVTNRVLPQTFFISLLVVFGVISFFSSAYLSINGKRYYNKTKEYDNQQDIVMNDILRVPEIAIGRDINMRIRIFQTALEESNKSSIDYTRKKNISNLLVTILEAVSQYGIIVLYLLGVEWSEINLGTIAQITANLVIVEIALSYIGRIFRTISYYAEIVNEVDEEKEDIEKILKVYYSEIKRTASAEKITDIIIPEFSISYEESSENDKPFELVAKAPIEIKEGEIAILYGPSGSGKSTFMSMITQRISLRQSTTIPSTSRFLFYDEKLRFGSLSIYEELFCCSESPDFDKMQQILENLHLWAEISQNCHSVWTWMKEKKFGQSLSNGQKQRLILAKMLYWLDGNTDVLVLDEATSGLDDNNKAESDSADASRILEYITRFANKDRKRTVIIATHQNIDDFVEKMSDDGYSFKTLIFCKSGETNEVRQVN